jgi:tetratricopeptide (TPR) repeat protein
MGFQGDLRSIELADLLQSMASRQQSGLVEIMTRDGKWQLSLRDGAIVGLTSQPSHDFWSRLVLNGMLTEEQLREARGAARKHLALAKVLIDKGCIKAERLRSFFIEFLHDELCEVLTLRRGRVEMRENEFLNDKNWAALDVKLPVTKVIFESARRHDHWEFVRRYIHGPRVVLLSVSCAQQALEAREGNEIAAAILTKVMPDRSIGDIADSLPYSRSEVFREAAELVKHGLLKYANPEDSPKEEPASKSPPCARAPTPETALDLFAPTEEAPPHSVAAPNPAHEQPAAAAPGATAPAATRSAIAEFVKTHEADPSDIATLEKLVGTLEGQGREDERAMYLENLATQQLATQNVARAIECLRAAYQAAPHNPAPAEQLLALLVAQHDIAGMEDLGLELLRQLRQLGLHERSLAAAQKLVDALGPRPELMAELGFAEIGLNRKQKGLRLLTQASRGFLDADDITAAEDCYREMARVAPTTTRRHDASDGATAPPADVDRARRVRFVCAIVGAIALGTVIVFGSYEAHARAKFIALTCKVVHDGVEDSAKVDAAIGELSRFRAAYPASLAAAFDADKLLRELADKQTSLCTEPPPPQGAPDAPAQPGQGGAPPAGGERGHRNP